MATSYHNSLDEALEAINEHEINTCTKYIRVGGHMSRLTIPAGEKDPQKLMLCFGDGVRPYLKEGSTTLHCLHGSDQHVAKKNREKKRKSQMKDDDRAEPKSTRRYIQDTYKLGCPAKVTLARQLILDAYQEGIDMRNLKKYRKAITAKVKSAFMSQGYGHRARVRYVLTLPELQVHAGHPVGEDNPGYQPMDERLREKTKQIVTELGVTATSKVKTHLDDFVNNTIFRDHTKPPETNQRFFPHAKTLKNCIDKVLAQALANGLDIETMTSAAAIAFSPTDENTSRTQPCHSSSVMGHVEEMLTYTNGPTATDAKDTDSIRERCRDVLQQLNNITYQDNLSIEYLTKLSNELNVLKVKMTGRLPAKNRLTAPKALPKPHQGFKRKQSAASNSFVKARKLARKAHTGLSTTSPNRGTFNYRLLIDGKALNVVPASSMISESEIPCNNYLLISSDTGTSAANQDFV